MNTVLIQYLNPERMVDMTNLACIGYAIMAAKAAGLSKATIDKLEAALYEQMDEYTEYEAEKAYRKEQAQ